MTKRNKVNSLEINALIKDLQSLIPKIDKNVVRLDYFPKELSLDNKDYAILYTEKGGLLQYMKCIDISKKNPFKIVSTIIGTMDDYMLNNMYVPEKKAELILTQYNRVTASQEERIRGTELKDRSFLEFLSKKNKDISDAFKNGSKTTYEDYYILETYLEFTKEKIIEENNEKTAEYEPIF
jgi:hypothetical protein